MMAESQTVRALTALGSLLLAAFRGSRSRRGLLLSLDFLETSFFHSRTYRLVEKTPSLYPARLWGLFDSANRAFSGSLLMRIGIFHPLFLFPLTYFGFVAISRYRPSFLALFSILLGLAFFALGVSLSRRVEIDSILFEGASPKIAVLLLSVGLGALLTDLLLAGTIPLFDPVGRRYLNVTFTMLSTVLVPGGILLISLIGRRREEGRLTLPEARVYGLTTLLLTTALIALLGYRTQILVSLLGGSIALLHRRLVGPTEILLALASALGTVAALGYLRAQELGSALGFLEVIGGRTALTLSVYDTLINRFWLFGVNHGTVALATFSSFLPFVPGPRLGPRTIVANLFGIRDVSITSTLLGTVVLDFGLPGIALFMLLLGSIVGIAYYAMRRTESPLATAIFALFLAYTLVGIETGLVDFIVFLYFLGGTLLLLASRRTGREG
jgi:oligosaccharide repeat unit polymerase